MSVSVTPTAAPVGRGCGSIESATDLGPTGGTRGPASSAASSKTLREHTDVEVIMARAVHENFPVALRALPDNLRRHLQAIYGYARLTDNLGDEYPGDRLAALDWLDEQLEDLFAGNASHPVFRELLPTVKAFGLSRTPFDRLLAANRMDQHKKSYANWDELMEYCRLSANPVGHLVLAVCESATDDRTAASDAVCSGLQVLEHLQDLGEDARAGRIYMPADDMERFGCAPGDLLAPVTGERLRKLVAYQVGRTRGLVDEGRWLVASLRGYPRLAVAGFVAGGLAGLDAISAARFDVLGGNRQAGNLRLIRRIVPLYLGSLARRRPAR